MFYIFAVICAVILTAGITYLNIIKGWFKIIAIASATLLISVTSYQIGWVDGYDAGKVFLDQYYNPNDILGIVDKIENGFIVIEQPKNCGDPIIVHESFLPDYVIEGDVIMKDLSVNIGETFNRYLFNKRKLEQLTN